MKLVKMLSLAAVAAIAAMAFVGTSSAFAEKAVLLCELEELECTHPWGSPVEITGNAVKPTLLSSLGTVECEKSEAVLSLTQSKLEPLQLAQIKELNFTGNCHLGKTTCTVTVGSKGGVSITHGANPLEWIGIPVESGGKNTEATVTCGALINCTYIGGAETETVATNSATGKATLTANKAPLKKVKGLCPSVSEWDAVYKDEMEDLWLES